MLLTLKVTTKFKKRLRKEFKSIPDTEYAGRRGETGEVIRRKPNQISTEKAAIALVAFHGEPYLTYHKKREIWNEENYSKYFDSNLTATHLVFTYSLLKAIEQKKEELKKKTELKSLEIEIYEFLKKRGGMRLLLAAIGQSIEEILDRPVPNLKRLSFGSLSWKDATEIWKDIIDKTIMFCIKLGPGIDNGILNPDYVPDAIKEFKISIASQVAANKSMFNDFKNKIVTT